MNKARRIELMKLKYKKRLRNFRHLSPYICPKLMNPKGVDANGVHYNLTAFRSHGTPCSCPCCQQVGDRYNRAKEKQALHKEIKQLTT